MVNSIDNHSGPENISNLFADQYSKLFNQRDDDQDLQVLKKNINNKIGDLSKKNIEKINSVLVKEALLKLKPQKQDALFNIVSEMYINGPDELAFHLAKLIRACLYHGTVPQ